MRTVFVVEAFYKKHAVKADAHSAIGVYEKESTAINKKKEYERMSDIAYANITKHPVL